MTEAMRLKKRLKAIGLSPSVIQAAWPDWWSDAADPSPSAKLELRFSVARKLGLDAHSLLDEEGIPRFVWRDEARFKHLAGESDLERAAMTSFGKALAALLIAATPTQHRSLRQVSANEIRRAILSSQPFVTLRDLLTLSWSVG